MNKNKNIQATLGSDPELCLFNRTKKKIVSAIPVLKNDKYSPADLGNGIRMYADNVLVETAFPPCNSKQHILDTLADVFNRMQKRLGDKFGLVPKAAHVYDKSELKDKKAWEAGCDPNFNAYAGMVNPAPSFTNGLRTGSFHIHIGNKHYETDETTLSTFDGRHDVIKLLDVLVGVPSIVFDKDESSSQRRALYGKSGEFRPTPYGVEYRVLGNFALRSPKCTELVFDLVDYAIEHIKKGSFIDVLKLADEKDVRATIDNNDAKLGLSVLKKVKLPSSLLKRIQKDYDADFSKSWGLA